MEFCTECEADEVRRAVCAGDACWLAGKEGASHAFRRNANSALLLERLLGTWLEECEGCIPLECFRYTQLAGSEDEQGVMDLDWMADVW